MHKKSSIPIAMKTRKYYCSSCGDKLIPYPKTRILKRGDPDYREHSYFGKGRHLVGDIELTEYDFKCLSCDKHISYNEQCVIEKMQKHFGRHILSEQDIAEQYQKVSEELNQKRKIRSIISKIIGAAAAILAIYCWLKSGNFSLEFYF